MKRTLCHFVAPGVVLATMFVLVFCMSPGPAVAAGDSAGIQPINKVPRVFSPKAIKQGQKESLGIPWFAGTGVFSQKLENSCLVDGDRELHFAQGIVYRAEATGQDIPSSTFGVGTKVGWELDENGRVKGLWLLKEQ